MVVKLSICYKFSVFLKTLTVTLKHMIHI